MPGLSVRWRGVNPSGLGNGVSRAVKTSADEGESGGGIHGGSEVAGDRAKPQKRLAESGFEIRALPLFFAS